jgi:hypothetical protein
MQQLRKTPGVKEVKIVTEVDRDRKVTTVLDVATLYPVDATASGYSDKQFNAIVDAAVEAMKQNSNIDRAHIHQA